MYLSVCDHSHGRISWSIFAKIGTDVNTPKRKEKVVRGSISRHTFPYFVPQSPLFRPRGPKNHANIKNNCLKCTRIAEISPSLKKSGSRNTIVMSDFWQEIEMWPFCVCAMHPANGHNYRNSSFIVALAMGQIVPRSTERISSWKWDVVHGLFSVNCLSINHYKLVSVNSYKTAHTRSQ